MEILDWLKSQNIAEMQIAHDEICYLRTANAELQRKAAEAQAINTMKDDVLNVVKSYLELIYGIDKTDTTDMHKTVCAALAIQPSANVLEDFDIEALQDSIKKLLVGIDKDECEDSSGWWETSTGAAFGTGVLAALLQLISDCAPLYRLKDK